MLILVKVAPKIISFHDTHWKVSRETKFTITNNVFIQLRRTADWLSTATVCFDKNKKIIVAFYSNASHWKSKSNIWIIS